MTLQLSLQKEATMSADFEAKVSIPTDLIQEFVELLTNKESFDKWKAVRLALKVAQWLVDSFGGLSAPAEDKPEELTEEQLAEALKPYSVEDAVVAKAIPVWLLPIIAKLIIKWLTK
jgi:hypothetical protein